MILSAFTLISHNTQKSTGTVQYRYCTVQVLYSTGTVNILSSDPPCTDDIARFKALHLIKNVEENFVFLTRKVFYAKNVFLVSKK